MHVADPRWCWIGAESLRVESRWCGGCWSLFPGRRRGQGRGLEVLTLPWPLSPSLSLSATLPAELLSPDPTFSFPPRLLSPPHANFSRRLLLVPARQFLSPLAAGPRAPISLAARCWFPLSPALLVAHGVLFRIWQAKSRHMDDTRIWRTPQTKRIARLDATLSDRATPLYSDEIATP